jgi:hypothetical protein
MGIERWEAYQVEGQVSLAQILNRQFLPVVPMALDRDAYLGRLRTDWKIQGK